MSDSKTKSSLDLAYDLAVDSYEPLVRRLDITDGRLQTIMGFSATTMALVTSVASTRNLSFRSFWFWAATIVFVSIVAIGSHARHYGEIKMIDPSKFAADWLDLQAKEFKEFFLDYAGTHWNCNNNLVDWKWRRSVSISILFFAQVVLLVAWVAARHF